jgi:hypothetical protein
MPCDTATRSTSRFVFAGLTTPSSSQCVMKESASTLMRRLEVTVWD